MRHAKRIKKLGRTSAHRKATMAAMSTSLLEHKRITTTLPKAKALRSFVEPIINRAKEDTTNNRRQVFRRLQSKEAVKTLFGEVAEVLGDRPGGYTRIVKLGQRAGDAAEMAIIELVDFNDVKPDGASTTKKKTRRSRRKSSDESPVAEVVATAEVSAGVVEEMAEVTDEELEDAAAEVEDVVEAADEEIAEAAAAVEDVVENADEAISEAAVEVEETVEAADPFADAVEVVEEATSEEVEATTEDAPDAEETPTDEAEAEATDEEDGEKAE